MYVNITQIQTTEHIILNTMMTCAIQTNAIYKNQHPLTGHEDVMSHEQNLQ